MAEASKGEYRSGHDQRTLRDALGCFATGVTVVTCLKPDGAPAGLTVNSFTSVSLDPPLLLVCIRREASSAEALIGAAQFAVNVLQTGQQPASIRFATRSEDRFGATPWSRGEAGAPILEESLGVFECERFAVHDGGDHHILVGRVVKASFDAGLDPLLFFRGRYRRLHFD
jgi:flavin reductase (DIM6/NTAB) family NADH-FMN oxidoreductase RutF